MEFEINYWIILLVGFVSVALGAIWYSPKGFGKTWMAAVGITPEQAAEGMKKGMKGMSKELSINFLISLVGAYVMAHFVQIAQVVTFWQGVQLGFWIWFGFLVPSLINPLLWEKKPWNYFVVNAGYYLVLLMLSGGIFAEWGLKTIL